MESKILPRFFSHPDLFPRDKAVHHLGLPAVIFIYLFLPSVATSADLNIYPLTHRFWSALLANGQTHVMV